MKIVLVAIVVGIIAGAGGGYFGYTTAYGTALAAGTAVGQDSGKKQGLAEGQISGNTTGYNTGHAIGLKDGYSDGYKDGLGAVKDPLVLHNPTFAEAKAFLKADPTDQIPYNDLTFVCTHYARNVVNNAVKLGIRTAYVEVRHPDMSHSLVAFETTDKGIIYFDPQYDNLALPVVGEKYWKCMMPTDSGTTFSAPNFDDTINEILIIW